MGYKIIYTEFMEHHNAILVNQYDYLNEILNIPTTIKGLGGFSRYHTVGAWKKK